MSTLKQFQFFSDHGLIPPAPQPEASLPGGGYTVCYLLVGGGGGGGNAWGGGGGGGGGVCSGSTRCS